jgi:hypothetical protein
MDISNTKEKNRGHSRIHIRTTESDRKYFKHTNLHQNFKENEIHMSIAVNLTFLKEDNKT